LEAKGWKGKSGSAIILQRGVHQFYTDLSRSSAEQGRFALYLLKLNGAVIAYEYSLRAQGKIDMLKPSFDPDLSRYSPGNVLRMMILRAEVEKGQIKSYHLGRPSPWKTLWTRRTNALCRLRVFAPRLKARLAYRFGPWTRLMLKRSAVLRGIVTRIRAVHQIHAK
jgi:CelD/BcsL family acetyltransferase involved in cellulose biosynthesis